MSNPKPSTSRSSTSRLGHKRAFEVDEDDDSPSAKQLKHVKASHHLWEASRQAFEADLAATPRDTGVPPASASWTTSERDLEATYVDPQIKRKGRHVKASHASSKATEQSFVALLPTAPDDPTSKLDGEVRLEDPFVSPSTGRSLATQALHAASDESSSKELSKTAPTSESILQSSTTTPNNSLSSTGTDECTENSRSSQWTSKEDWTEYRKLITRLYSQHSLSDVMRIMESQYRFKATYAATIDMFGSNVANWV